MLCCKRPLVLISAISLLQIFLILAFPQHFPYILTASITVSAFVLVFFITKRRVAFAVIFCSALLLCVFMARFVYVQKELSAENFVENAKEDSIYTAVTTKIEKYGSYSSIYATLFEEDGKPVKNHKIKLSSYSGDGLLCGDIICFTGTPEKASEIPREDFDTASYLRSKNIFIHFTRTEIVSSSPGERMSFSARLRDYTRNVFYKFIPKKYNYTEAQVAYAMFSGDRAYIPSQIKSDFRQSGISHILCVSGLHVSIITGAIYAFLSLLTVGKKTRCLCVICFCVLFCAFTGFSVSAVRASIMCCISFTAMILGKNSDGFVSLFFAMLMISVASPYSVLDISAILSFLATLGIILFINITKSSQWLNNLPKPLLLLLKSLFISFGAFLFTLPICAYAFGTVSVYSALATIIVTPFCELLLTFLLVLVIISPLSGMTFFLVISDALGSICRVLCDAIITIAKTFASFKFSYIPSVFPEAFILLFSALFIVLCFAIAFDFKKSFTVLALLFILSGCVSSVLAMSFAIIDDTEYKVLYYRKNIDDRQLTVKLGKHGYLIVNRDNRIYEGDGYFDAKGGLNYLLIIPDDSITPAILADNIRAFSSEYGIKKVFVPKSPEALELARALTEDGIACFEFNNYYNLDGINLEFSHSGEHFRISVSDSKTKTSVVFADNYSKELFEGDEDICAYFTRKTSCQFDLENDVPPDCDMFFTRMKKDYAAEGITNTYNMKEFYIKE